MNMASKGTQTEAPVRAKHLRNRAYRYKQQRARASGEETRQQTKKRRARDVYMRHEAPRRNRGQQRTGGATRAHLRGNRCTQHLKRRKTAKTKQERDRRSAKARRKHPRSRVDRDRAQEEPERSTGGRAIASVRLFFEKRRKLRKTSKTRA